MWCGIHNVYARIYKFIYLSNVYIRVFREYKLQLFLDVDHILNCLVDIKMNIQVYIMINSIDYYWKEEQ